MLTSLGPCIRIRGQLPGRRDQDLAFDAIFIIVGLNVPSIARTQISPPSMCVIAKPEKRPRHSTLVRDELVLSLLARR